MYTGFAPVRNPRNIGIEHRTLCFRSVPTIHHWASALNFVLINLFTIDLCAHIATVRTRGPYCIYASRNKLKTSYDPFNTQN